jgi:hypothetical protein
VQTMSTTLGQTLEELAEQRGIEQGIEQGELAASRRLLCRLLERQFGPVTDELRQRIHQVEDLDRLEQAIVDCPCLDSLDELEL